MLKKEKIYFRFVVQDRNLLIFGDSALEHFNEVFKKFHKFYYIEQTEYTLENLTSIIYQNKIDVLIVTAAKNRSQICNLLDILQRDEDIHILTYIDLQDKEPFEDLINISDSVFTNSISSDQLEYKLYVCLSDIIQNNKKTMKKEKNSTDEYKDAFELEVMFISEEFLDISKAIDNGDISNELFDRLRSNLSKVIHIIDSHLMHSDVIKKLVRDFKLFLEGFDIESVEVENIEGFEYLARLIEDIASFLEKYFISRKFDDIYVVEDSLENSLKFMRRSFDKDENDDESELEFF
ncbi:MAG: hypothetical protein U9Q33_02555 [Campylobacterota bacterium]|nr:hypothetical protein [Campylobacterota bacterium]